MLIPRYYNVYRTKRDRDVYWKWSPLVFPSSIKSLRTLSSELSTVEALLRLICSHLQKEPSAVIFLKPVDHTVWPLAFC